VSGCMLRSVTYELQAGGNTLRSLVVRTTPSGAVEVELPRYKVVCKSEMCLFGIEVSPPITILRNRRWQVVPRRRRRKVERAYVTMGMNDSGLPVRFI
jgi:hypothetical protein